MSKALYAYATDKIFFENSFNVLDKGNTLDRNIIKRELMLLIIITVDYLLRSQKIQKRYGDKGNQLMINFLSHFKNETDKKGTSDSFINLLEERRNVYNHFIETDNPSASTHAPFKIAEQLQKYCGVNNDPLFTMGVIKIWELNFKTLENMFEKFKLVT
jgi:hypothetical protein